jgi:hypothetical protein
MMHHCYDTHSHMFSIKVSSIDKPTPTHPDSPSSKWDTSQFDASVGKKSSSVRRNKSYHSPERSVEKKNTETIYQTNTDSPRGVMDDVSSPYLLQDYNKSPLKKIISFEKFLELTEAYKNAVHYTDNLTFNEFICSQLTNPLDYSDESIANNRKALDSIDYTLGQQYASIKNSGDDSYYNPDTDPIINLVVTFSSDHRPKTYDK